MARLPLNFLPYYCELYIHFPTKKVGFRFGRDIGGAIYQFNQRDYWWGGNYIIHNAIYYESTDLATCVNPDRIDVFINEAMNLTPKLGKAPLRFSPSKKLWIIHENGISILNNGNNHISCEKEKTLNPEVVVYPNPSNGLLNLNFPESFLSKINIKVYNSNGQLFLEKDIYKGLAELDLTHLKYGNYFLKFTHQDWTHVEKISIF